MADLVFNIAKGRAAELYNRVDLNDPANAVLVIAVFSVTGDQDASIRDADTLAAVEALASVAEVTNTGYSRITLSDTDLAAFAPDDTNDRVDLDFADQTFSSISSGDGWTDTLVGYDSDSTGGTDANIVPLTFHDTVATPNGGDITIQPSASGFYRAA